MSHQTKTNELTMTVLMTPEMANFSGNVLWWNDPQNS